MDNLTHSLAGLAVAEIVAQRQSNQKLRGPLYVVALVASNLPDVDALFRLVNGFSKILQHRGHTHTLVGLIPQFLLIFCISYPLLHKKFQMQKTHWYSYMSVAGICLFLHIFLDAMNSFGVHPFWPFDNRWYYLDVVFLIEPLFWIIFAISFFHNFQLKIAKALMLALLMASLIFGTFSESTPLILKNFYWVFAIGYLFIIEKVKWRFKEYSGLVLASLVFLALGIGSYSLKIKVAEAAKGKYPSINLKSVYVTANPGNFLCWKGTIIEKQYNKIFIRAGRLALLPSIYPLENCHEELGHGLIPELELKKIDYLSAKNFNFDKVLSMDLEVMNALKEQNCYFASYLNFARIPIWAHDDVSISFSDFRFSRRRKKNRIRRYKFPLMSKNCSVIYSIPWESPSKNWNE